MEIKQETFFLVGAWCFGIVALMTGLTLYYTWYNKLIFQRISDMANIFFNVVLVLFFLTLYKQSKPQISVNEENEIKQIIEEVKKAHSHKPYKDKKRRA